MDIRTVTPEISEHMSHGPYPRPANTKLYPLRILARVFAGFGLAAVVYALVIVTIAFESAIIEF